jgi:hypothetical protein
MNQTCFDDEQEEEEGDCDGDGDGWIVSVEFQTMT